MKLRDHPRISYHGFSTWPPAWLWRGGNHYSEPTGEVGVLTDVKLSRLEPCQTCFLIIEHEGQEYVGALLFDDPLFCRQVFELLTEHNGESLQRIGELEIFGIREAI